MEYLDPVKKRKHRQRIAIGYVLIGLIISMVTIIVLLAGYGYGFDRKTGEFVQNGIMFVDTRHRAAEVYLNGVSYGQTDLRLVLREGSYSLSAKRDGYREWKRDVVMKGGNLRVLTYGLMVPEVLQPQQQLELAEQPDRMIQSIDKDRLLAWDSKNNANLLLFDLSQDLVTITRLPLQSIVESSVNISSDAAGTLPMVSDIELVDFDSSDERVLAYITIGSKRYTWLLDTRDIAQSRNISGALPSAFKSDAIEITMIDRNPNRYYLFDETAGEVYEAELQGNTLRFVTLPDITKRILAFTSYDTDWYLFVTESEGNEGLVDVYYRRGDKTALLKQMKTSEQYFLELANNEGKAFIGIGASNETAVFVYTDPIVYLEKNPGSTIPAPSSIMPMQNLLDLSISADASIIMGLNSSTVVTYDFQTEESFTKTLDYTITSKEQVRWIDGQHYSYVDNGIAWVVDFDGSNQQQLTAASSVGIAYRDDSEGYYSFVNSASQADGAPAYAMSFTSLLTEADQ